MNDNRRTVPKVAITRAMVEAGKGSLDALTAEDLPIDVTDDQLVAQIFQSMWTAYWEEVIAVRAKKKAGSPLIKPKSGIIVPFRN